MQERGILHQGDSSLALGLEVVGMTTIHFPAGMMIAYLLESDLKEWIAINMRHGVVMNGLELLN